MNREYTYVDDKVIIRDENGNQRVVEYCDNLNEILIQENLLEEIENQPKYRLNQIITAIIAAISGGVITYIISFIQGG